MTAHEYHVTLLGDVNSVDTNPIYPQFDSNVKCSPHCLLLVHAPCSAHNLYGHMIAPPHLYALVQGCLYAVTAYVPQKDVLTLPLLRSAIVVSL